MTSSRVLRSIAAALLVAVSAGCGDTPVPVAPPESALSLAADASASLPADDGPATVAYTLSNSGSTDVRITTRCGDVLSPAIEQLVGHRWEQYGGNGCLAIYGTSPVPLAGRSSRSGTVTLIEPGTFRLVLGTEHGPVASGAIVVR